MLWRSRDCYGMRFSRITYPKCTSRNICAYRSIVLRRWRNPAGSPAAGGFSLASMKVPTRRWGNAAARPGTTLSMRCLYESPRPKAGKYNFVLVITVTLIASMKVPARKRRNPSSMLEGLLSGRRLNESPHSKVGKMLGMPGNYIFVTSLNESLSQKERK